MTFLDRIINFFKKSKKSEKFINEILFYGAEDEAASQELGVTNLFCIYYLLGHATTSIDMCVPSLISETIAQCLARVAQKDVKIRVAIHKSDNFSHLDSLAQSGIEVKVINSERLEHEFALIDAGGDCSESVAVIGSLDYDQAKVNCNRDHTLLTSEEKALSALKKEFDRIWASAPDFLKKDSSNCYARSNHE